MNKTVITAHVIDQTLHLVTCPRIASGGVDEVKIRFDFCSLWDGCGKIAVFYRDPEVVYHVPIVDGVATVPHEVLADAGHFYIGVMGAADNIRTTEVLRVRVVQGAITEATAEPKDPTPDIYQQLLAAYGTLETSLAVAQARVDSVLENYVTPELFGAVGDGVTDDTIAIQKAIDSGKPCVLNGTYLIKGALSVIGEHIQITINGALIVGGDVGIVLGGRYNVIDGAGKITVASGKTATAIRVVTYPAIGIGNLISVQEICSNDRKNNNTAIEITDATQKGGGCFDVVRSNIRLFRYGIISKATHETSGCWYTDLTIDCRFTECLQAVVFDWQCNGSTIKGSYQPMYITDAGVPEGFDRDLPLVKTTLDCDIDAFFWDFSEDGTRSVNKYSVLVGGANNYIRSNHDSRFVKVPIEYRDSTTNVYNFLRNDLLIAQRTGNGITRFDNSNDMLNGCLYNRNITASLHLVEKKYVKDDAGNLTDDVETVEAEKNFRHTNFPYLFDGKNTKGIISAVSKKEECASDEYEYHLLFKFSDPQTVRAVSMLAGIYPEKIKIAVATDAECGAFTQLGELASGVDYEEKSFDSRYNSAYWVSSFNDNTVYNTLGGFSGRTVYGLKIILVCKYGKKYEASRLSAFTMDADVMKQTGGSFFGDVDFVKGHGFVLKSPGGYRFKVKVANDGTLTTERVSETCLI